MLNDTQCKQAKAGEKPLKLSDGKGLYLLIQTTGVKYWRMDYRFAGKRKTLALGVYPETPLKLARQKRDEARRLLEAGTDPSEIRRTDKIARKVAADSCRAWIVPPVPPVKAVVDGLDLLIELGHLEAWQEPTRGRVKTLYVVNPKSVPFAGAKR